MLMLRKIERTVDPCASQCCCSTIIFSSTILGSGTMNNPFRSIILKLEDKLSFF
jgi:hypothetical protein